LAASLTAPAPAGITLTGWLYVTSGNRERTTRAAATGAIWPYIHVLQSEVRRDVT